MFDVRAFYVKCVKDSSPFFNGDFGKKCDNGFDVKNGEVLRVHDKSDGMWEISYSNGRLFWTDLGLLMDSCVTVCMDKMIGDRKYTYDYEMCGLVT